MNPSGQADRLSDLPNVLLVILISSLSFKQGVQTSLLSKRWRYLYRETRNVSFKEIEFLTPSSYADPIRCVCERMAFVGYVRLWVARIRDQPIDSFGFSVSDPRKYVDEITSLIAFAVQKRVKNLVLDFSHPAWRSKSDVTLLDLVIEIPPSLYALTSLETLKVGACKNFDPSKLSSVGGLKSVCLRWMELTMLVPLLNAAKKLESLTLENCWGLEFGLISGENIREVVIRNCDFFLNCTLDLPRVDVLKYSGEVACFVFERMNTVISEVELDFRMLDTQDDELIDATPPEGGMLCELLNNLLDGGRRTATTLTVCPFLLKMIPRAEHPHLLLPMKTKHLVLMTKLHPKEFNGIRILLMNCPNLETLTLDLLPPSPDATASPWAAINPQTYWMQNISYMCLRSTLKTVVVKNFVGGARELHFMKFFIRSGGEHLERVELYLPFDLDKDLEIFARARAEMLQGNSNRVQVLVHSS